MKKKYFIALLIVALGSVASYATPPGDDPPLWMTQARSQSIPTYERDVPGVVLHDEQQTTLSSNGTLVTVENFAVKILTREGLGLAEARAYYLVSSGKIREMNGWIIRPDGTSKSYDKKSVVDLISDPDDVYNEGRYKKIDASNDVDTGFVFGYTVVSEESALFFQDQWQFQSSLPTLISRYSLTLPQGWSASSITFNAAEIKPQVNGSSYLWELRNLPPVKYEPMSPSITNLTPRIAINYNPDGASQAGLRTFANWVDVSRWATGLHDGQVIVDDTVAAKARELTASATNEFDKIRAIARFVQNLQYISIDIGLAYGNGYKPRSSALVLARGYGDCKDKANLMRAMLRSLKIEAYPIAIYSGDPTFVRSQWASPRQFNHCIIAVRVSDQTQAATIITDPKLGRLLIFDATDSYTALGDLPDYLQGSMALLIAGENGGLVKMPETPSQANLLERRVEATISPSGAIEGKIVERANGQTSSTFRRETRTLSASDYRKVIEGWLTRGATGAQLVDMKTGDRNGDGAFDLEVAFTASSYAQVQQGRLLIFKPVIVGRFGGATLTEPKRHNPIELDNYTMTETAAFTLPAGFIVDETPDPIALDTQFGKYTTKYEVKDNKLHFTRSVTMSRVVLGADKYETVRSFFSKMREAEQAPVVLIKK